MEVLSHFSGFQVTWKAATDLRHLVTESKWKKLQKHFSVSLTFNCCRCNLTLPELDALYEHFSADHQVDLSYIQTLLQESTREGDHPNTEPIELSENLIKDLLHTGEKNDTCQEDNTEYNCTYEVDGLTEISAQEHNTVELSNENILDKSTFSSTKRKGRPRKRPLTDDYQQESGIESNVSAQRNTSPPKRKRAAKKKTVDGSTVGKQVNAQVAPSARKSPRKGTSTENFEINENEVPFKGENEENFETDPIALVNKVIDVTEPAIPSNMLKKGKARASGRDLESEEIKSKTCAICKEMQASIQDCFTHYEVVHNFVPKSVYEKPPVDQKFEQNKAKRGASPRGRTRTDNNAEQCRFCGKMFLKNNIDKHIHLRHYWLRIERKEQRRQTVMCHLCGKVYHHTQNLEAHIAAVHRGTARPKKKKVPTATLR